MLLEKFKNQNETHEKKKNGYKIQNFNEYFDIHISISISISIHLSIYACVCVLHLQCKVKII